MVTTLSSGSIEISNCTFENNIYEEGGTILLHDSGNINIRRCIFQNMVVNEPVIIYLSMASTAITNCSFQYIESGNIVHAESSDNIYIQKAYSKV